MENRNILEEIKLCKDSLPSKQRQLCNFILTNYKSIGMATVAELAELASVGTTTVMRLIAVLGYKTYNDFKKDLFSITVLQENSSYQNLKSAFGEKQGNLLSLEAVGSEQISVVRDILTEDNLSCFEKMVEIMLAAKRIFLFAQRSSKAAAIYAEDVLMPILSEKLVQLSDRPDFLTDYVLRMEQGDILFLICNWPSSVVTVNAAELCYKKGIPIVMITNSSANPIAKYCTACFDTNSVGNLCLLAPAILVIEALSLELTKRMVPVSTKRVEELEKALRENHQLIW